MSRYFDFIRRQWPLLLFGFCCVFWGNLGQSFFLGWFGEAIKTDLDITAQTYGTLYSAATLASAVTMLWLGALIDRWSLPRYTLLVTLGLCLAAATLFFSVNIAVLALGFYLIRLFGQGLMPHIGLTTMARNFNQDRGKAISLASMGVSVGEVTLPLLAVFLMGAIGWRMTWLWLAISIPLLLLPILYALLHQSKRHLLSSMHSAQALSKQGRSGRSILLLDYRYWLALPTLLSLPFMLTAIFIHQDYLLLSKHWSHEWMASSFVLYGMVHWLSSLLFGILVDRFSGLKLLPIYTVPLILALYLLANCEGQWVALVMMILLGAAIGASGPVVGSLWAEVYGTDVLGGVRSTSGSLIVLSTAMSPILFGWFIDHGISARSVFNGAAVFFSLAWVGLWFSYGKDQVITDAG